MRLQDKVILVTGSTTGIGKAIAKRCVREGAKVIIHGLEKDLAEATLAEIGAEAEKIWNYKGAQIVVQTGDDNTTPANSHPVAVSHIEDLMSPGCPQRLIDLAVKTYGRLDGVVNNAAMVAQGNIQTTDAAFFHKMLAVNTVIPFLLIQAALPHLSKARGAVLNIGSVNAYSGEPNLLPYSVSKGALTTLTRNLGDTLHRLNGVRVNQINPGWVLTENEAKRKKEHGLKDDWYADLPRVYAPSGRLITPDEIAAASIYWLADEAGPISGSVVELEQHPFIGRNPPKDPETLPGQKA
jgi:NAD(P)-dependent dehydrogenase (short-subunit alcohol dehydrogenase family)